MVQASGSFPQNLLGLRPDLRQRLGLPPIRFPEFMNHLIILLRTTFGFACLATLAQAAAPADPKSPTGEGGAKTDAVGSASGPQLPGLTPEEETEKSGEPPVWGRMEGYVPKPTLREDLKNLQIPLVQGYASRRPRLLFSADDRESLIQRSLEQPALWNAVLESAERLKSPDTVPAPDIIRDGSKYWRIERVQSAALAWFVTGNPDYRDGAIRWMLAHAKEPVWGTKFRPNLDLEASWYLYHISIAYDILWPAMTPEQRAAIREGLTEHARIIYQEKDPRKEGLKLRYDQNHTYIPTVALTAAALALLDEVEDAKHWLTRSYAVLRRSRYVLNEDGYYYEGFGYWTYALNWHARGAELLARATGEKLFDLPALRDTWRFGLHLSLPGAPGVFPVGDTNGWEDGRFVDIKANNYAMLWEAATLNNSGESRTVGDLYYARQPDLDYPATSFLWFNPKIEPVPLGQIEPYHYFSDQDVIAWRSGWDADATCYLFRCGPPLGHKAAAKLEQLDDWIMNCGHVHPDIGSFWMFAKGAFLAVTTGYTAEKWTRDHNTLLVDEKGQGMDGEYHNEHGVPYAQLDQARITSQFLSPEYGFARGEFGTAYQRLVPGVRLTRSLLMTKDWLLIIDDMAADQPRSLTWLCHSAGPFQKESQAYVSRQANAALAVLPLAPDSIEARPEPTIVIAGTAPGRGTPTERGHKLGLRTRDAVPATRFVNLLVPLGNNDKIPEASLIKDEGDLISIQIKWPDGRTERTDLNLGWKAGAAQAGPASFVRKP